MAFFDALRTALSRYADGVHDSQPPLSAEALRAVEARLGQGLPASYADFLLSFDGVTLFHEAQVLFPAAQIQPVPGLPGLLRVGETPEGALYLRGDGGLLLVDEEAPDPILAGSAVEPFLDAVLARDALILDRDGEFRDVFGDDGSLTPPIRKKRAEAGRKKDPRSALFAFELGELAFEASDDDAACARLTEAVQLDPQAGPAWALLAALYLTRGQPEAAEHASVAGASAPGCDPNLRAARLLEAAVAVAAQPDKAAAYGRQALQASAELFGQLVDEGKRALGEGAVEEAEHLLRRLRVLRLAAEQGPTQSGELEALERALRTRSALRVVD